MKTQNEKNNHDIKLVKAAALKRGLEINRHMAMRIIRTRPAGVFAGLMTEYLAEKLVAEYPEKIRIIRKKPGTIKRENFSFDFSKAIVENDFVDSKARVIVAGEYLKLTFFDSDYSKREWNRLAKKFRFNKAENIFEVAFKLSDVFNKKSLIYGE
jgi:hypothetical protein